MPKNFTLAISPVGTGLTLVADYGVFAQTGQAATLTYTPASAEATILTQENFNTGTWAFSSSPYSGTFDSSNLTAMGGMTVGDSTNGYDGNQAFIHTWTSPTINTHYGSMFGGSGYSFSSGAGSGKRYVVGFRFRFGPESRGNIDQIKYIDGSRAEGNFRALTSFRRGSTDGENNGNIFIDANIYTAASGGNFIGMTFADGITRPALAVPVTYACWHSVICEFLSSTGASDGHIKIWVNNPDPDNPTGQVTGINSTWDTGMNAREFGGVNWNGGGGWDAGSIIMDDFRTYDVYDETFFSDYTWLESIGSQQWMPRFNGDFVPGTGTTATTAAYNGDFTDDSAGCTTTIEDTGGYDGGPCMQHIIDASTANNVDGYHAHNFGDYRNTGGYGPIDDPAETEFVLEGYFYHGAASTVTWPTNSMKLWIVQTHHLVSTWGRGAQVYMYIDTNGRYQIDHAVPDNASWNGVSPTSSPPFATRNGWDYIRVYAKLDTDGTNGIVQGWVNGTQYWNSSNLDILEDLDGESFNRLIAGYYASSIWRDTQEVTFKQSGLKLYSPRATHACEEHYSV